MEKSEKIAVFAISVNLALFGIKFTFAMLSQSITLKAEAIHSLSDVVASLTVFGGLMLAKRKSTKFPYGLYKEADIVLKTHDFDKAHFVANRIETNIKEAIKNVDHVLIMNPPNLNHAQIQKHSIIRRGALCQQKDACC
ncbi:hypothetical protein FJZ31_33005 [Candidatus Poribacteria bacterium]|nr:hypothetical protein [Candidatus Poribacteria bacterium]